MANFLPSAQVHVMDMDADFRAWEKESTTISAKGVQRRSVTWVSPADKTGRAPYFFVTPDALPRRA